MKKLGKANNKINRKCRRERNKQISEQSRVARFFLAQHTKTVKIYQINMKYIKWHKLYTMAAKRPNGL
jgi:macrodomain Ter protein organizer (MatP/YcbG family)